MKDNKTIEEIFVKKYKPQISSEGMRSFVYKDYQMSRDEFIKDLKDLQKQTHNQAIKGAIEKLEEYKEGTEKYPMRDHNNELREDWNKGHKYSLKYSIKTLSSLIKE